MKKDALPLSSEQITNLSKAELVAYAEANENCFCVRCIHDVLHPDFSPSFGIVTKVIIPALSWWELQKNGKSEFRGIDPLPPGKLETIFEEVKDSGAKLILKDRVEIEHTFFTAMSEGRVEIETSSRNFVLLINHLGVVKASGPDLRNFLKGWEDEKNVNERKRLQYANYFPRLGKLTENPEIEVIHYEACKLRAARKEYDEALQKISSGANDFQDAAKLQHPDNEIHRNDRNLLVEQVIGRLVIQKMSRRDYKFFDLLAEIAKNLEIEQAMPRKPGIATDRKRQVLFMASKLIEKTAMLPLKNDLFNAINSDFSKHEFYDERQFRKDLKSLGLGGLPTTQ